MSTQTKRTETDWISRLGCMRRNTIVEDSRWGPVEHIEVWVPTPLELSVKQSGQKHRSAATNNGLTS